MEQENKEYTIVYQDQNGSRPDRNPVEEIVINAKSPGGAIEVLNSKMVSDKMVGATHKPLIIRIYIQHPNGREECEFVGNL